MGNTALNCLVWLGMPFMYLILILSRSEYKNGPPNTLPLVYLYASAMLGLTVSLPLMCVLLLLMVGVI